MEHHAEGPVFQGHGHAVKWGHLPETFGVVCGRFEHVGEAYANAGEASKAKDFYESMVGQWAAFRGSFRNPIFF